MIVISTVLTRSRATSTPASAAGAGAGAGVEEDAEHGPITVNNTGASIGFLRAPKRFNVALTRYAVYGGD